MPRAVVGRQEVVKLRAINQASDATRNEVTRNEVLLVDRLRRGVSIAQEITEADSGFRQQEVEGAAVGGIGIDHGVEGDSIHLSGVIHVKRQCEAVARGEEAHEIKTKI